MKGLPVAQFPAPTSAGSTYYVVTTTDQGGRLADHSPLQLLGWPPGATVSVRIRQNRFVVVKLGSGPHALTGQGHLRLPLAVRRFCRIEAGDRLLVAVSGDLAGLTICSTDILDPILRHTTSSHAGVSDDRS